MAKAPTTLRLLDLRANAISELSSLKSLAHLVNLEDLRLAGMWLGEWWGQKVESGDLLVARR
jgi:hypothetical protein